MINYNFLFTLNSNFDLKFKYFVFHSQWNYNWVINRNNKKKIEVINDIPLLFLLWVVKYNIIFGINILLVSECLFSDNSIPIIRRSFNTESLCYSSTI